MRLQSQGSWPWLMSRLRLSMHSRYGNNVLHQHHFYSMPADSAESCSCMRDAGWLPAQVPDLCNTQGMEKDLIILCTAITRPGALQLTGSV